MTGAVSALLTIEHVSMRFGGLVAIDDVSFDIRAGDITAVIGPNGAGKTTLFNCITGFYKPTAGRMTLKGETGEFLLEQIPGYRIAQQAKVARTFQNIRLFAGMSVLENLMVAQHNKLMRASGFSIAGLLGLPSYRRVEREAVEKAKFWLDRVGLTAQADDSAGSLPYGGQRRLEIARAMCIDPVILCLDEPAAGLNPRESQELNGLLRAIRDEHRTSVLLIEHDMSVVMQISDHIVVLDHGKKIADGTPEQIRSDEAVIRAYLGEPEEDDLPPEIAADVANATGAAATGEARS
ncbi:ABC transporter ATP-binding protein [Inquilinus limosus]|uniref:ABC transporter ATP-binding protein n=1 Tax=Inquilinus limosus TaxID=171674 RepID=A0A211ZJ88_9PROT|nr:ABC transporter ATP-binding protein [Inquilinus limosus]OWJ65321.1 ABC transporter ATP-binding protein [Inquilinus limosus]